MSEKHRKEEIKLILILLVLAIVVYGIFAVLTISNNKKVDYATEELSNLQLAGKIDKLVIDNLGPCGKFTLINDKGNWSCEEYPEIPINDSACVTLAGTLKEFKAKRVLHDAKSNASAFGLLHGDTLTTTIDGVERTLVVGKYNTTLDCCYVADQSNLDDVYIITGTQVALVDVSLLGLIDKPEIKGINANDIKSYKVETQTEEYTATYNGSNFVITKDGKTYTGDGFSCKQLYDIIGNIKFTTTSAIRADYETKAGYGLTNPDVKITYTTTDGREFVTKFSRDGDAAVFMENENGIIYNIPLDKFEEAIQKANSSNYIN